MNKRLQGILLCAVLVMSVPAVAQEESDHKAWWYPLFAQKTVMAFAALVTSCCFAALWQWRKKSKMSEKDWIPSEPARQPVTCPSNNKLIEQPKGQSVDDRQKVSDENLEPMSERLAAGLNFLRLPKDPVQSECYYEQTLYQKAYKKFAKFLNTKNRQQGVLSQKPLHQEDAEYVFPASQPIPKREQDEKAESEIKTVSDSDRARLVRDEASEAGKKVIAAVVAGTYDLVSKSVEDLSCVMWYLHQCALAKGQGFTEGVFVINSKDATVSERLFNFFMQSAVVLKNGVIVNRERYKYRATHYGEYRGADKWRFDIHPGDTRYGLPNNHTTIVFDKLSYALHDGYLQFFIKPEKNGCKNWFDWGKHALSYTQSLYRHSLNPAANDVADYRKEHVPQNVIAEWKKVQELYFPHLASGKKSYAQKYGIWAMRKVLQNDLDAAKRFDEYLTNTMGYELCTLPLRKGNEVHLFADEWLTGPHKAPPSLEQAG